MADRRADLGFALRGDRGRVGPVGVVLGVLGNRVLGGARGHLERGKTRKDTGQVCEQPLRLGVGQRRQRARQGVDLSKVCGVEFCLDVVPHAAE
jgi:hypothetical protein